MRYWLFFAFIFLKINYGFAQEREELLGKITNDSLGDTFINIVNLTAETGTVNEPTSPMADLVFWCERTTVFYFLQCNFKKNTFL